MSTLPPGHERRYLSEKATVAHVVDTLSVSDAGLFASSRCGKWPDMMGWRGTGAHSERARAATLPLCRTCDRLTP